MTNYLKGNIMKKYLFTLSFLALILFIDYVLFIIIAIVFNLSGAEYQFFQGTYKIIGISIVGISILSAGLYLRNMLPKLTYIQ